MVMPSGESMRDAEVPTSQNVGHPFCLARQLRCQLEKDMQICEAEVRQRYETAESNEREAQELRGLNRQLAVDIADLRQQIAWRKQQSRPPKRRHIAPPLSASTQRVRSCAVEECRSPPKLIPEEQERTSAESGFVQPVASTSRHETEIHGDYSGMSMASSAQEAANALERAAQAASHQVASHPIFLEESLVGRLELEASVAASERAKLRQESAQLTFESEEVEGDDLEAANDQADQAALIEDLAERRRAIALRDRRLSLALSEVEEALSSEGYTLCLRGESTGQLTASPPNSKLARGVARRVSFHAEVE